jgi:hypothetical protein
MQQSHYGFSFLHENDNLIKSISANMYTYNPEASITVSCSQSEPPCHALGARVMVFYTVLLTIFFYNP